MAPAIQSLEPALSEHHRFVRDRLRSLGVPDAALDDATQDVFEVFVRRLGDYDPERPLRHWLAGIARRVARRHREPGARVVPFDEARAAARGVSPEERTSQREQWAVLEEFLGRLDADRWRVFVLSELEGLRGTEIAAELGENLNTVYARLRSAHRELDRVLQRHRARDRQRLAAVAPLAWLRRDGLGSGGSWIGPLGVVVIGSVAGALMLRACDHEREHPPARLQPLASPSTAAAPLDATAAGTERSPGGIAPRPSDPAQVTPRPATEDAWQSAGSSVSVGPDGTLHTRGRYRIEGDELLYEVTYLGDDEQETVAVAHLDLDGFVVVDGDASWQRDLAPDEELTVRVRLRAVAPGRVELTVHSGDTTHDPILAALETAGDSSSRLHRFFLDDRRLRPCRAQECPPALVEARSGVRVEIELVNECEHEARYGIWGGGPGDPTLPPEVPIDSLAPGARRRIEIDTAQRLHRIVDDRHYGAVSLGGPGVVTFTCDGTRARTGTLDPDDPGPGLDAPQR